MGQQQLLLLVLGIVIVGLAVVVGLTTYERARKANNADALVHDAVRISAEVQRWALTPEMTGGGGGAFTGLTFTGMGYATGVDGAATDEYTTPNAVWSLAVDGPGQVTLTGCHGELGNEVTSVVTGFGPDSIATDVSTAGCE